MTRKWREDFMNQAGRYGIGADDARKLLRFAATLQRLAEVQCNGDWPYDNGQRKVTPCSECESGCVPSQLRKGGRCPDCRTTELARVFVESLFGSYTLPSGGPAQGAIWTAEFQGDPRGCVLTIKRADGVSLGVPS